jgi:hypothetical protein
MHQRVRPALRAGALHCAVTHVPDAKSMHDSMIAATALEHGLALVTRNVSDFAGIHVKLINPWEVEGQLIHVQATVH